MDGERQAIYKTFAALADMVTEFLEIISHTVLFNYGGYPAETFDTASYGSILIHVSMILERLIFYLFIGQFISALKISMLFKKEISRLGGSNYSNFLKNFLLFQKKKI